MKNLDKLRINVSDVVVVATNDYGLEAHGKAKEGEGGFFWGEFKKTLEIYGVKVSIFKNSDSFLKNTESYNNAILVLVFNESCIFSPVAIKELEKVQQAMSNRSNKFVVCNNPESGRIMGNKLVANLELTRSRVPMPKLITEATGDNVFINSLVGSGENVRVSNDIDPEKYNTQYIDTTHEFQGKEYFISIRAMCVGSTVCATMIRARDKSENNPSVHASNTPANSLLINYLNAAVVFPRAEAISKACRYAGDRLGLGFYAYDILPDRNSRDVFICEAGFKFEEFSMRDYMYRIRDELIDAEFMTSKGIRSATLTLLAEGNRMLN